MPMRRESLASRCSTDVKRDLVLRLLGGEAVADLARETGRPERQLSAWQDRFLAGGEAYLEGRRDDRELEALRASASQWEVELGELKNENRRLARQVAILGRSPSGRVEPHPYCTASYLRACEEAAVQQLRVPEWGSYVLVREGQAGVRQATGIRPLGPLDPGCEVGAGLDRLRDAGIASVALVTDPMWSPDPDALREAFDACRPFRENYLVDREAEVHVGKRHRNRINRARRAGRVGEVALAEHLDRWLALYGENVENRQIRQPFGRAYFERLAEMSSLRTIAVLVGEEIVTMTLWLEHEDTLYFHESASSVTGNRVSAGYAAFTHAIESAGARYVLLGGSAALRDDPLDGVAMFKRGFANGSATSYLCSATLPSV